MSYSNGLLSDQSYQTANKYVQRGLPGVGFKLTVTGDYDMQNKKLVNVDEGENNQDVVNKHQLDVGLQTKPNKTSVLLLDGTTHMVGDLDLRGNKIILPGEIQMDQKLITNLDTDENQDLSAVNMITLKNKVEPKADKNYVDFEITKQNALINNAFVKKTGDQMNGDLILPHDSYPVGGNTNKAISYESQREIFLSRQESFPMQADINMNNNFIQNIATPTSSHQVVNKGYCDYNFLNRQKGGRIMGSLSMNQNDLFEVPAPKYESSAANKNYVDNQMGTKADLSKTTTQTFQGRVQVPDFNSGGHNGSDIVNLRYIDGIFLNKKTGGTLNNPITFLSSLPSNQRQIHNIGSPQFISSAANKQYVDGEIGKIAPVDTTQFIKKDGSVPMVAYLDMGTHKIINVGQPTTVTDAASKGYIDNTLAESHLTSSHKSNEFKYLNDPNETSSEYNITIDAFTDFNESPHKNKKAFQITITKDVGTNDYRSRMGFNLYPLPLGTYTIIFEYYFPENTNIQLSCQSTTAYVHKQIQKDFTDYSKLLVQINNNSKTTPDYLFFTIHGTAVVNNPEGYIIVYGVKDWSDSVDPNIYDDGFYVQMFQYKNGDMQIQTDIDMNTHKIENLSDATNTKDAINKGQLDAYKALNDEIFTNNNSKMKILTELDMDNNKIINLKNAVNKNDVINKGQLDEFKNEFERYRFYIKNHSFLDIFSYLVFDFNEPGKFIVKFFNQDSYISGIASNETPSLNISSTLNKRISYNNFKPKKGIQFSSSHRLIMELDYNVDEHSSYTLLIIMTLKDNLKLYFIEPTQGLISYYPVYIINKVRRTLSIQTSNTDYLHSQQLPLAVSDQQIMIWIQHKAAPPPYSAQSFSKLTITGSGHGTTYSYLIPPSYFSTNKFRIETGNNIINKICYQHQYIEYSIQNPDYVRLLFEEMKNGTLVDLS